jgi:hypothetical protein
MLETKEENEVRRQRIHEQAHQVVFQLEEKEEEWRNNSNQACAYLGQVIIGYLFVISVNISSSFSPRSQYEHIAQVTFEGKILPLYTASFRAKEEKDAMLADLAIWLTRQSLGVFHEELSMKEIIDPEAVFSRFRAP